MRVYRILPDLEMVPLHPKRTCVIGLRPFKAKGSRGSGQPKPEAMQPKPSEKLQLLHVYPPDNHRLASPKPRPKT